MSNGSCSRKRICQMGRAFGNAYVKSVCSQNVLSEALVVETVHLRARTSRTSRTPRSSIDNVVEHVRRGDEHTKKRHPRHTRATPCAATTGRVGACASECGGRGRAHLSDLPRLMVPPDERDAVGVADLQRQQHQKRLHAVTARHARVTASKSGARTTQPGDHGDVERQRPRACYRVPHEQARPLKGNAHARATACRTNRHAH